LERHVGWKPDALRTTWSVFHYCCRSPSKYTCWQDLSGSYERCCFPALPALIEGNSSTFPLGWAHREISEDLERWSSGFHHSKLSEFYGSLASASIRAERQEKKFGYETFLPGVSSVYRFVVSDGQLHDISRADMLAGKQEEQDLLSIRLLERSLGLRALPEGVDFIYVPDNGPNCVPGLDLCEAIGAYAFQAGSGDFPICQLPVPILAVGRCFSDNALRVPHVAQLTGISLRDLNILAQVDLYPWAFKSPSLFWRGSPPLEYYWQQSPGRTDYERFCSTVRGRLVALSAMFGKEVLDARFIDLGERNAKNPDLRRALEHMSLGNWTEKIEWVSRKYIVHVEGQYGSYSHGLSWKLLSGSLVFYTGTPHQDNWIHNGIEAWRHYVPVSPDLSDLKAKLHWAQANDDEAQHIATRAFEFGLRHLSWENSLAYLAVLLRGYSNLLQQ